MASELFVVQHGAGTPMLVIHGGLGLDHTHLRPAFDTLGDRARLFYPDLRGNGRSPRDGFAGIDAATAADLDAIRRAHGIDRWIVAGHSYGSFVALQYALAYPAHVSTLVLLGAGASFGHMEAVAANVYKRAPDRAAEILELLGKPIDSDEQFAAKWPELVPLYFHTYQPAHQLPFANTRYSAAGYNHGATFLATYDITSRLPEIRTETLVISADDDWIMPVEHTGAPLAAALPNATAITIERAGHFMFLERPEASLAPIHAVLERG